MRNNCYNMLISCMNVQLARSSNELIEKSFATLCFCIKSYFNYLFFKRDMFIIS